MNKRILLLTPVSRSAIRDHVKDWLQKYGRLDRDVVDYLRNWVRDEHEFLSMRNRFSLSEENKREYSKR